MDGLWMRPQDASISQHQRMYGLEVIKLTTAGFPDTISGNASDINEELGEQNPKIDT